MEENDSSPANDWTMDLPLTHARFKQYYVGRGKSSLEICIM